MMEKTHLGNQPNPEPLRLLEQAARDLNQAHDELMLAQGATLEEARRLDWPEWAPQANTIRGIEKLLGKRVAKTSLWSLFPDPTTIENEAKS